MYAEVEHRNDACAWRAHCNAYSLLEELFSESERDLFIQNCFIDFLMKTCRETILTYVRLSNNHSDNILVLIFCIALFMLTDCTF